MDAPHAHDSELVEAVARRVVELLDDRGAVDDEAAADLLTVAEVAARYRVRPRWVYAHQRELGAIRLGHGPKARLRFHAGLLPLELPLARPEPLSTRQRPRPRRLQRQMAKPRHDH